MKKEIDYELFDAMRDLCEAVLSYVDSDHFLDDCDPESGDYKFHIYDGGLVFISKAQMEQLRKLKEIF